MYICNLFTAEQLKKKKKQKKQWYNAAAVVTQLKMLKITALKLFDRDPGV